MCSFDPGASLLLLQETKKELTMERFAKALQPNRIEYRRLYDNMRRYRDH